MSKNNRCIISGVDVSLLPFAYNEGSRECRKIKTNILNSIAKLYHSGVDEFYTDCSFGFPLWGAEIVMGLMMYNDIRLYVLFPHENHPYKLALEWQERFYKVHELCTDVIPMYMETDIETDRIVFLHDEEMLIKKAADYMVADCGRLLFFGDGEDYIYKEAVKQRLTIHKVDI